MTVETCNDCPAIKPADAKGWKTLYDDSPLCPSCYGDGRDYAECASCEKVMYDIYVDDEGRELCGNCGDFNANITGYGCL